MNRAQKIYAAGMKAAEKYPKSHIAISTDTKKLVAHGQNFGKVYSVAIKQVPSGKVFFCKKSAAHVCPATI